MIDQNIFNDIKQSSIQIWKSYDDTYGYATEKIDRVNDIENYSDNYSFIVGMFDAHNMRKLMNMVQPKTKEFLEPLFSLYVSGEDTLKQLGIKV